MTKSKRGRSSKFDHSRSSSRLTTTLLGAVLFSVASAQSTAANAHRAPIGIILMAQGRSGSTMLGETFRQNKDVLYWYEPCRAWGRGLFGSSQQYHKEIHGWECSELVRRLARCEFTLYDSARLAVDPAALESGSPRLEQLAATFAAPSADTLAQAHEAVLAECRKSRAVVVKTIRADTGVGGPDGNASGLLVVHLVRDPRAVIHSQIKTFNVAHKYRRYFPGPLGVPSAEIAGGNATEATGEDGKEGLTALPWDGRDRAHALGLIICGVYRDQLDSSASLGNKRYLRVRYEDIASSADLAIERIYHWSGLGAVPSRVSIWVHENTRLPDCGKDPTDATTTAAATETFTPLNNAAASTNQETHRYSPAAASNRRLRDNARQKDLTLLDVAEAEVLAAVEAATRVTRASGGDGGQAGGGDRAGGRGGADAEVYLRCRERMAIQAEWDKYGTRRHAAAMVGLWRKKMSEEESVAVWAACADSGVMDTMGYNL